MRVKACVYVCDLSDDSNCLWHCQVHFGRQSREREWHAENTRWCCFWLAMERLYSLIGPAFWRFSGCKWSEDWEACFWGKNDWPGHLHEVSWNHQFQHKLVLTRVLKRNKLLSLQPYSVNIWHFVWNSTLFSCSWIASVRSSSENYLSNLWKIKTDIIGRSVLRLKNRSNKTILFKSYNFWIKPLTIYNLPSLNMKMPWYGMIYHTNFGSTKILKLK